MHKRIAHYTISVRCP